MKQADDGRRPRGGKELRPSDGKGSGIRALGQTHRQDHPQDRSGDEVHQDPDLALAGAAGGPHRDASDEAVDETRDAGEAE